MGGGCRLVVGWVVGRGGRVRWVGRCRVVVGGWWWVGVVG